MALFKICLIKLFCINNSSNFLNFFLRTQNSRFFKFLISGVIASSINFIFYRTIFLLFNNILFASICGYFLGLLVSFLFAKLWVFQDRSKRSIIKSFSLFCLIYFFGGLEMSLVIFFLNQSINNYKIAWFFGALVGSINNYLGSKYISFRK